MRNLTTFAVFVALVAAGCGKGADAGSAPGMDDYNAKIGPLLQKYGAAVSIPNPKTPADVVKKMGEMDVTLSGIVSELKAINPPAEAKGVHGAILAMVTKHDEAIRDVLVTARTGDKAATQAKLEALSDKVKVLFDALDQETARAGFDKKAAAGDPPRFVKMTS